MFDRLLLLFHTVRFLKIIQVVNRIKRTLVKSRVGLYHSLKVSDPVNDISQVVLRPQTMLGMDNFKILNRNISIQALSDWNAPSQDKLLLYNLHYFDDLNAVGSSDRVFWHCNLIQKWIDENPLGMGNGWEPYPSSLRIVNWIKWLLVNNSPNQKWLDSLVVQTRFLGKNLEYHLLGNHLFANAKALIFSGLYFCGSEADRWYESGLEIFNKELLEQVLDDGGNFELSPMYHAIFLEDLLDIVNIHQVYAKDVPSSVKTTIVKMFKWLNAMCHPDGEVSFFNDSALGVAPTLSDLSNYAERLGIVLNNNQREQLTYLRNSGYVRVDMGELSLIADIAEVGAKYIPGHGHADTLSFELSLFKKRLIVNSGISTYEAGVDRELQRATSAHSTVTIDGVNSSEVWDVFRVARKAKVFDVNSIKKNDSIEFSACHDGYKSIKKGILHCRRWRVTNNMLSIMDNISGSGIHEVASTLPLHPDVVLVDTQNNSANLVLEDKKIKISFQGDGVLEIKKSHYYPEFGLSINNKQLVYSCNVKLPSKIHVEISW